MIVGRRRDRLEEFAKNHSQVAVQTLAELPADQARELAHVKVVAPTMLTRVAVGGMQDPGSGTIINVAGMLAFSGPAPSSVMPRRAVYTGGLAFALAMSQTLSAELDGTGVRVQVPDLAAFRAQSPQLATRYHAN